jgi:dTDP-4-amino-4,6-dideoxygalactose transaminase
MKKKIKLFDPFVVGEEEKYLKSILKSGFWASGAGVGYVAEFEEKFRRYVDSKSCVAVNSGTAALHLALSALDLRNGEVILPSLSFVSTAHAVIYNGGRPVFADVDPQTLCIDPDDVLKKVNKKTKAIIPVHFAGMSSDLHRLMKLAKDSNVKLIEDAAHACGATFMGKKIGSHGDMICFSFHPVKNLAMPSGGLVSINQGNYKKLKNDFASKRWCGITDRNESFYNVKEIGWNFYMNEFSAGIGLAQLKKLDHLNNMRKRIAKRYHREINVKNKMPYSADCSYHFYWIRVRNRDEFRKKMKNAGIETGIHYRPIHTFSMYKNNSHLPTTEIVGNSIVTLPTHPNLNDHDIDFIIKSVNKFS